MHSNLFIVAPALPLRGRGLEIGTSTTAEADTPTTYTSIKNGLDYEFIEQRERPGRSPVVRLRGTHDGSVVTISLSSFSERFALKR